MTANNQPYNSDPSLIGQAQTILEAATSLQQHLDAASLPPPSFAPTGRRDWTDAVSLPDLLQTRLKLIDAAQIMLDLAMGPMDTLVHFAGAANTKLEVLRTLNQLKVAEHVPIEGDISLDELADKIQVNSSLLDRHLKCAYLMGIFRESRKGYVAHTGTSAAMPSMDPYIELRLGELFAKGTYHIAETMKLSNKTPVIPIELADAPNGGRDMWKQLVEDDRHGKGMEKFSAGMRALASFYFGGTSISFSQSFDWKALDKGVVVDVGGGNGHIAVNLAKDFPDLQFIVQDLESNSEPAKENIKQHGLEDRVRFLPQDFFKAQPTDLEPAAYLVSRVLHDWQDADCARILKPLLPAMEQYGTKLFITERVLPDNTGELSPYKEWSSRFTDILMYTLYGAKERSLKDFEKLLKETDSRLRVVRCTQPLNTVFGFLEVELSTT